IALAAIGAGEATGDAFDQCVLVDRQFDHAIEAAAAAGENAVKRGGLGFGARIAVEDGAGVRPHRIELFPDQCRDDLVRDQLAAFHHGLRLEADRRAGLDGRAQHVAGGELPHAVALDEPLGLRALACARRPQQDDVHGPSPPLTQMHVARATSCMIRQVRRSSSPQGRLAPGYPQRMRPLSFAFLIRSPYWCASRCDWIWVMVSTVTLTTISSE